MSDQPRRPVFFWLVLLICGLYAGLFVFTVYAVARYYGVEKAPGWRALADGRGWFVSDVDDAGPAAGRIQLGDRLLAINGDQRCAVLGNSWFVNVRGGDTYRVDLDRHGQRVSVDLLLPLAGGRYLWPIFLVCSLAFFICGAALGLLRPQDSQVRFVSLLLMSVGSTALQEALGAPRAFLVGWERSVFPALAVTWLFFGPMTYHFFSRFPTWRRPGPLWRSGRATLSRQGSTGSLWLGDRGREGTDPYHSTLRRLRSTPRRDDPRHRGTWIIHGPANRHFARPKTSFSFPSRYHILGRALA